VSVKYKSKFTSLTNENWEVCIIDASYTSYSDRVIADGGSVEAISCLPLDVENLVEFVRISTGPNGFNLEYGQRGDETYKPIKGSVVDFEWHIDGTDQEAFIEQIAQVQEQTYYVRINLEGELFWQGPILQDLIRIPFAFPQVISIQATDGLARLKGVKKAIPQFGNVTESIISIIRELDGANLWADNDVVLQTSTKWTEAQSISGSPANTFDTFEYCNLGALGVQYTEDEKGVKTYRSFYDYLVNVLTIFNARIFLSNGRYIIEQLDQLELGTTIYYNEYQRNYSFDGISNPSTATGVASRGTGFLPYLPLSSTSSTNRIKKDSSWTYLGAASKFKIRFDAGMDISTNSTRLTLPATNYTMRSLESDADGGIRFVFTPRLHKLINSDLVLDRGAFLTLSVTVKLIGSSTYYLASGGGSQQGIWTTSQSSVLVSARNYSVPRNSSIIIAGQPSDVTIIQTSEIPQDGVIEVSYTATVTNTMGGSSSFITLGTVSGSRGLSSGMTASLSLTNDQGVDLKGREYTVSNSVLTESTIEKDIGTVFIADLISSVNIPNKIKVFLNSGPGVVDASAWTIFGVGAAQALLELLLSVQMQQFEKPRRLFDINYYGRINPSRTLRFDSKDYLWNWLSIAARTSDISTEAFELERSATTQTVDNDDYFEDLQLSLSRGESFGIVDIGDTPNGVASPISGLVGGEIAGTVTSIPLQDALIYDLGYSGETITLLRTDGSSEEFQLDTDAIAGSTSISVVSKSVTNSIQTGSRVLTSSVQQSIKTTAKEVYSLDSIPDSELILENKGLITTSGFLTTWKDASGNANNFTGVALEPNFNGAFQVYFDGLTGRASNVTISQNSGYTLVLLIKLIEATTGKYVVYGNSGNVYISTGTGDDVTLGTSVKSVTAEIPRDEWVVFQARMDGISSEWRTNYGTWNAASLDTDTLETPHFGYDGSTNYCEMSLAAACIFANVLTDNQADAVTTNLINRV